MIRPDSLKIYHSGPHAAEQGKGADLVSMFYMWSLDKDHRRQNSQTPGVFMVQQIIAQSI